MPSRFEQLYQLPENLYSNDSPVILLKGVLSKDSQSGNMVVQLKFHNVSQYNIRGLKVTVVSYDITGAELDGTCDYQYLDMMIKPGGEFGSTKAIILPNSVSRSFSIKSITVIMGDGSVQEVSMPMESLPKTESLEKALNNAELVKQYQIAVNNSASVVPQDSGSIWTGNLWKCSCGTWNSEDTCTQCYAKKKTVFSNFNISLLTDAMNTRLKEVAEAKARMEQKQRELREKQQKEREEQERIRKEKRKKIIKVGRFVCIGVVVLAVILVVALWVAPKVKQNRTEKTLQNNYQAAVELMDAGQYDDAIEAFEELGDYGASSSNVRRCQYLLAIEMMDADQYEEAIAAFEKIGDYARSNSKIKECQYLMAKELMDDGNYKEAITVFEKATDYEDATQKVKECQYLLAVEMMDSGQYEDAITAFESLGNYKDSYSYVAEMLEVMNAVSGTCGDNVKWTIDDNGTLFIFGSGEMDDYENVVSVPWYNDHTDITSLIITSGVTSIGMASFIDCENLKDVIIPDSVISIGDGAFAYCENLSSVDIGSGVTSIGEVAFAYCNSLTSVTIPENVRNISLGAFAYCENLISVEIGSGVSSIGDEAFEYCESLENVKIKNGVKSIGETAFRCCTNLKDVTIPDSITTIEYAAFYDCTNLTNVYYGGNEAAWRAITIESNNSHLSKATIHYNCSD